MQWGRCELGHAAPVACASEDDEKCSNKLLDVRDLPIKFALTKNTGLRRPGRVGKAGRAFVQRLTETKARVTKLLN